jgi:hypothetical protein
VLCVYFRIGGDSPGMALMRCIRGKCLRFPSYPANRKRFTDSHSVECSRTPLRVLKMNSPSSA